MPTQHFSNLETPTPNIQAQVLYHWLTFVNQFPLVQASGPWSTVSYSGGSGETNSFSPTSFYDTTASPFDVTFVGKYIAVRDSANPENCLVSLVTNFVSATELTLSNLSTNFPTTATAIDYLVFDPAVAPAALDFFVLQTPVVTGPQWQMKCEITATPELSWELGYTGGWDVGTTSWVLPVSPTNYSHNVLARTFCTTDATSGYFYLWSEDVGGAASNINALWLGALSPFHSPVESGVPKDLSYAAVFGSEVAGTASNLARDTAVPTNVVVGSSLDPSGLPVTLYVAQKRLLSSGNDLLANAAAAINPRSSSRDDYDAIVFSLVPGAWRGRLTGVRILNDSISNRFPISSNLAYALGNGIGSVWNGKVPVA